MQKLRGLTLSEDRTYATIQGGAYGQELTDELWSENLTASKCQISRLQVRRANVRQPLEAAHVLDCLEQDSVGDGENGKAIMASSATISGA